MRKLEIADCRGHAGGDSTGNRPEQRVALQLSVAWSVAGRQWAILHRGFTGLRDGGRPGRPKSLDARQWTCLALDLRRDPRRCGPAQHLWDGTLLAEHLKQRIDRCQVAPYYFHSIFNSSIVTSWSKDGVLEILK